MGIILASNFDVNTGLPLDSRSRVADITARNAIPSLVRYIGMKVTVLDDGDGNQKLFWLVGGITNSDWQEFSSGSGSGVLSVADLTERNAIPAPARTEGMLAYVLSEDATYQLLGGTTNDYWLSLNVKTTDESLLGNGFSLSSSDDRFFEDFYIGGASGPVTALDLLFTDSITPRDGKEVNLIGVSNSNPAIINSSEISYGVKLNGDVAILTAYRILTLKWVAGLSIWVEKSRNF